MARSIIRDSVRLEKLAVELTLLMAAIDNDENVPERYDSTLGGALASLDAAILSQAWLIVSRLERWAKFEQSRTERYTRRLPASVA